VVPAGAPLKLTSTVDLLLVVVVVLELIGAADFKGNPAAFAVSSAVIPTRWDDSNFLTASSICAGVIPAVSTFATEIQNTIDDVTGFVDATFAEFNAAVSAFENGIDDFLQIGTDIGQAFAGIARAPARFLAGAKAKFDGYSGMFEDIGAQIVAGVEDLAGFLGIGTVSQAVSVTNIFTSIFAGAIECTLEGQDGESGGIQSRQEAVAMADGLADITTIMQAIFEAVDSVTFIPSPISGQKTVTEIAYHPSPEAISALMSTAAAARDSLLERAYSLRSEIRVILKSDRTPLDFVAEVYGGSIDALDEFIDTNNLSGDEIILMPSGREVIYYG